MQPPATAGTLRGGACRRAGGCRDSASLVLEDARQRLSQVSIIVLARTAPFAAQGSLAPLAGNGAGNSGTLEGPGLQSIEEGDLRWPGSRRGRGAGIVDGSFRSRKES